MEDTNLYGYISGSHQVGWQSVARSMGAPEEYIKQKCISLKQEYIPIN